MDITLDDEPMDEEPTDEPAIDRIRELASELATSAPPSEPFDLGEDNDEHPVTWDDIINALSRAG